MYNAAEEPKILMTGRWNEAMSYQVCDPEGEPLPGTEMKEVSCSTFCQCYAQFLLIIKMLCYLLIACTLFYRLCHYNSS